MVLCENFSYDTIKTYIKTPHKNSLSEEGLLIRRDKIQFYRELTKFMSQILVPPPSHTQ